MVLAFCSSINSTKFLFGFKFGFCGSARLYLRLYWVDLFLYLQNEKIDRQFGVSDDDEDDISYGRSTSDLFVRFSLSFSLYIGIAISPAPDPPTNFMAGGGLFDRNGMATADWMSAASFISMAGIIARRL